jgi:hypothetical protein
MIRKLFALAGVSALGGLVSTAGSAGCSGDPVSQALTPDSGTRTATEEPKSPTKAPDGGTKKDDEKESKTCLTTEKVDATKIPYATVGTQPGACTPDEGAELLRYLNAQLANGADFTQADWAGSVSDKCAKCVFTEKDAPKWGVIINEKDAFYGYNFGGCIEMLTGSETCGRAVQQAMMCAEDACAKCSTEQELNACLADSELVERPCKDAVAKVESDCGRTIGQHLKTCNGDGIATLIEFQCINGGTSGDAGGT